MSTPQSWMNRARTAAALAFLLALTAGYFWKLTLSRDYTWIENPDQVLQVRPWLDFESREIHQGRLPLWDPYHWGGQSLIGQVQPGVANPLNWILFAMPLDGGGHIPLRVLHWYWVLIHWLAAAFCFWLCRDLGSGYGASLVGASIFAFGGLMGHSATPQFLMSALWSPLVFLFLARVFRGHRPLASAALCACSLAAAFLGGHHNVPVYTAVLLGALWLWHIAVQKGRVPPVLVFAVVLALVAAVQMLPAIEYGRQAVRWSGAPQPQRWNEPVPYSVHAEYSLRARSLPGLIVPQLPAHASPFVGIAAIVLALTAIALRWRSPEVRLMAAVAAGGLVLALGSDTPVHRLVYVLIPMVEKARYPAMAVVLSQTGIAALAALGLEAAKARRKSLYPLGFALSALGAAFVSAALHLVPAGHPTWIMVAAALGSAAVLYGGRAVSPLVLALFFAEALTNPPPIQRLNQPGSSLGQIADQADIAQFLRSQPGWFRFRKDEDVVPYNFGDLHGIEEFGGYLASVPEKVFRSAWDARMFGIRFWVARTPSDPGQVEVFQSRSGVKVYRNPGIGEPLWSEHGVPCGGADRLTVASRVPDAMVIDADLACPGLVVVGDPYYRGWRAWVDGVRRPIQEYRGVVRALPVKTGRHRIEFRYRPWPVYWGAAATALGLLLTGLLGTLDRRHSRESRPE